MEKKKENRNKNENTTFLTESITDQQAAYLSTLFDAGGIVGGITAGFLADISGASGSISFGMLVIAAPLVSIRISCVRSVYATSWQILCPIAGG